MPSQAIEMTHPEGEYAYLKNAIQYFDDKNYQQALVILNDGISFFKRSLTSPRKKEYLSYLLTWRGYIHYLLNNDDHALRDLNDSKFLHPRSTDPYFISGLIYLNKKRTPFEAIGEFYTITQLCHQDRDAYINLAEAYYQCRYFDLAVESIVNAAKIKLDEATTSFIEKLLTDQLCLSNITKEQVVFLIKKLLPARAESFIDKCLDRESILGKKMWTPRFFGACSLDKGTLKVLSDHKKNIINSRM